MLLVALPVIFSLETPLQDRSDTADSLESATLLRRASIDIKRNQLNNPHQGILLTSKETLQHLYRQVYQRKNFRYLLSVFLIVSLASSGTPIFPQYISKRYGWTFAEAGYLLTVKAVVNVTLLTIIVPNAIKALHKYTRMNGVAINIASAKASEIISVIGIILIGTSTTMGVLILCKSPKSSSHIQSANGISTHFLCLWLRDASLHPFSCEEPTNCGTGRWCQFARL